MSRGLRASFILLLFLLVALAAPTTALADTVRLVINGQEVRLEHELLEVEAGAGAGARAGLLAPLLELAPYLGIELRREDQGYILCFGSGEEARLPQASLHLVAGVSYAPLAELAGLLGARLISFPDSTYLFVPRSELSSLSYAHAEGVIRLRFSRLAPLALASRGRTIEARFFNSVLGIAPRTSRFFQGAVEELELLSAAGADLVVLRLTLRRAGQAELKAGFSAEGSYQVELRIIPEEGPKSPNPGPAGLFLPLPLLKRPEQVRLTPWLSYHLELRQTPAGPVQIYYLLVKDYQAHARLRVAIPRDGLGKLERLEKMVAAQGGLGGINANFFDPRSLRPIGLLIQDGTVLSPPYGRRAALGVDLFGKAVIFEEGQPPLIPLREAVTGGPLLLKEGKIALDPKKEGFSEAFLQARAARSAIGLLAEGDLIMLIAIQNQGSVGLTLEELALLLQGLGAVEALALDGGSSSSLVFRRGKDLRAIGGREIAVGLVLIPK
ncbi:MAG: phosphodiester glycosidase family protein [Candidatus Bipolaricaulia bacterium]